MSLIFVYKLKITYISNRSKCYLFLIFLTLYISSKQFISRRDVPNYETEIVKKPDRVFEQ